MIIFKLRNIFNIEIMYECMIRKTHTRRVFAKQIIITNTNSLSISVIK